MKIIVLDGFAANPGDISWDELNSIGDVRIYDRSPRETVAERIGDAEIILVNKVIIDEEIMSQCPKLHYIGLFSTGYNIIDLEAAKSRQITVCNVPAYSTAAVVQHTFALLFELSAHTALHSESVRSGRWSDCVDFCFWDKPLMELAGKTLGLVGFGQIGSSVAKVAVALGMKVLACAKHARQDPGIEGIQFTDYETVLKSSDIISLHCPQTQENLNMINIDSIAKMKDGVVLLNTARGGLINESDLAKALHSGKVSGFGADVLASEPPDKNCPLIGAPNTVITPHIAWAPLETRERLIGIALENLRAFLRGTPQNTVG